MNFGEFADKLLNPSALRKMAQEFDSMEKISHCWTPTPPTIAFLHSAMSGMRNGVSDTWAIFRTLNSGTSQRHWYVTSRVTQWPQLF
jgi:hypothetical protein